MYGVEVYSSEFFSNCLLITTDIETERTHQSLFQGVTGFDKAGMKHTETQEKVSLPAKEGRKCPALNSKII